METQIPKETPTVKTRIRKSGLQGLYLSRSGEWTTWQHAAKFSSDTAAERFAEKHGVTGYGLFTSPCFVDGYPRP